MTRSLRPSIRATAFDRSPARRRGRGVSATARSPVCLALGCGGSARGRPPRRASVDAAGAGAPRSAAPAARGGRDHHRAPRPVPGHGDRVGLGPRAALDRARPRGRRPARPRAGRRRRHRARRRAGLPHRSRALPAHARRRARPASRWRAPSSSRRSRRWSGRRRLADQQVVPQQQLDTQVTRHAVQQARVTQAEARVHRAEQDLERTTVHAPYHGFVVDRRLHEGAMLNPASVVLTLQQAGGYEALLSVPEAARLPVRAGRSGAHSGRGHSGRDRVAGARRQRAHRPAEPHLRGAGARLDAYRTRPLKAGAFVRAEIDPVPIADSLLLDREAILTRDGRNYVFRVHGERAEQVPIELGATGARLAEVHAGVDEDEQRGGGRRGRAPRRRRADPGDRRAAAAESARRCRRPSAPAVASADIGRRPAPPAGMAPYRRPRADDEPAADLDPPPGLRASC